MSDRPPNRGSNRRLVWITLSVLALVCVPLAILILCTKTLSGAAPAQPSIRAVLDRQVKCWNADDLEGFMTGYWNSDQLTFFSGGTVNKGYKAVLARYRQRYQSEGKEMGKLTFSDLDVKQLGDTGSTAATARGRWKLVTSKATVEGLFTLVLHRFPEGWKIVHDHTSEATGRQP